MGINYCMASRSLTVSKNSVIHKYNDHKSRISNDFSYDNYYPNQGLPNLGNTCFLNSAIQFLYSSSLFRTAITQNRNLPKTLENYLAKIF